MCTTLKSNKVDVDVSFVFFQSSFPTYPPFTIRLTLNDNYISVYGIMTLGRVEGTKGGRRRGAEAGHKIFSKLVRSVS